MIKNKILFGKTQNLIFRTLDDCIPLVGDRFIYPSKYGDYETYGIIKSVFMDTIVSTNGVTYRIDKILLNKQKRRDDIISSLLNES